MGITKAAAKKASEVSKKITAQKAVQKKVEKNTVKIKLSDLSVGTLANAIQKATRLTSQANTLFSQANHAKNEAEQANFQADNIAAMILESKGLNSKDYDLRGTKLNPETKELVLVKKSKV